MKHLILVDTCNILHRLPGYKDRLSDGMDLLSEQLLQQVRILHDLEHWELHLIVDGKGKILEKRSIDNHKTLSIIFTAAGQSADTVIETWLMRLGQGWNVRVVSEDRAIAHSSFAHNAEILSADEFVAWVDRVHARFTRFNLSRSNNPQKQFGNQLDGLL